MDNKIFNVNGEDQSRLARVLAAALSDPLESYDGFISDEEYGLIWVSSMSYTESIEHDKWVMFPIPITPAQAAEMTMEWLESAMAKNMKCEGWDADTDHDGSNYRGWRVYVEDWGNVGPYCNVIAAVRTAYIWYGK